MKKSLKILIAVISVLALIGVSVLGTLAYFSAKKTVTNVFTIGKIAILLDEAVTDELGVVETQRATDEDENEATDADGEPVYEEKRSAQGNYYNLLPGHTYTKDPQVTVKAESDDAYVRVVVRINNKDLFDDIKEEIDEDALTIVGLDDNWELVTNSNGKYLKDGEFGYEFRYKTLVEKNETQNTVLDKVFTHIKASDKLTSEHVEALQAIDTSGTPLEINVEAHAIQADGFTSAGDAWAAFDEQMYPEPVATQQ